MVDVFLQPSRSLDVVCMIFIEESDQDIDIQ